MGRSGGAITTKGALKIELSKFIKEGAIQKGKKVSGEMNWTNGASIGFESSFTESDKWLRLSYSMNTDGAKLNLDYKIYLDSVPSNIGKGTVYYFICPISGKRARILYKCYGSHYWKHRDAYQNRIFYRSQIDSNYNDRYWTIKSKIDALGERITKEHYKGKATRLIKRYNYLLQRQDYYDRMRMGELMLFFQKFKKK